MPAVSKDQAVERLSTEIERLGCDDLVEVHNELFPDAPRSMENGQVKRDELVAKIMTYVHEGLEMEEIIDLWNVVFPTDRNVWYDDESDAVHFNEEPEQVEYTE